MFNGWIALVAIVVALLGQYYWARYYHGYLRMSSKDDEKEEDNETKGE